MPTTNFVEFNSTQSNQQTDGTYDSFALTTGGIQLDDILPSPWLNKIWRQSNAFVTAFALMLKNKGYSTSDVSVPTLASVLANVVTQADLRSPMVVLSYNPFLFMDASLADGFQITLTGNVATITIGGYVFGQEITLAFTQDGTGGRTVAWPSNILSAGTVDPTANATSLQKFKVLSDSKLHPVAPMVVS